jgi:hypothetical protein
VIASGRAVVATESNRGGDQLMTARYCGHPCMTLRHGECLLAGMKRPMMMCAVIGALGSIGCGGDVEVKSPDDAERHEERAEDKADRAEDKADRAQDKADEAREDASEAKDEAH